MFVCWLRRSFFIRSIQYLPLVLFHFNSHTIISSIWLLLKLNSISFDRYECKRFVWNIVAIVSFEKKIVFLSLPSAIQCVKKFIQMNQWIEVDFHLTNAHSIETLFRLFSLPLSLSLPWSCTFGYYHLFAHNYELHIDRIHIGLKI